MDYLRVRHGLVDQTLFPRTCSRVQWGLNYASTQLCTVEVPILVTINYRSTHTHTVGSCELDTLSHTEMLAMFFSVRSETTHACFEPLWRMSSVAAYWRMRSERRQENKVLLTSHFFFHALHHPSTLCTSLKNVIEVLTLVDYAIQPVWCRHLTNLAPFCLATFERVLLISFVRLVCNSAISSVILVLVLTGVLKTSHS